MPDPQSALSDRLERVGRFSARNPRPIVVLALVLLFVAGGVALATVQLNMGMMLYIDDDSEVARDWEELESSYDRGNVVFAVVESEDVTDPETVRAIDRLDARYTELDRIDSVRSLADVVRMGAGGRIPETEQGVERAIASVKQHPGSGTLVETVAPESGTAVLLLSYGEVAPPPEDGGLLDVVATKDSDIIEQRVTQQTDAAAVPAGTSVTVTGASIFENAAFELMLFDVLTLFAGGFVLVLVVVYVVMRGRIHTNWHAFLPLATALVALVVMLAAMGLLSYDFNAIMLSVLPVSLGLGVDYGLQVQTRYAEERDGGAAPVDAAGDAASTTGRTLLLAMGTTVIGFGSLFLSSIPPVRQFGVTAAISVLTAMVLSVTLLVALLVRFDDGDGRNTAPGTGSVGQSGDDGATGYLEAAIATVGGGSAARPLLVLLLVAPAVAGGAMAYPHVDTTQQMLDFWPQDIQERQEFESTAETVPGSKTVYVLVETDGAYTPSIFRDVSAFQRRVAGFERVDSVGGPVRSVTTATGGSVPDSPDRIRALAGRAAENPLTGVQDPTRNPDQLLVTVRVSDVEGAEVRTLVDRIDGAAAAEVQGAAVAITGKPVVNRVIIENGTSGQLGMTALSFGLALLFLLLALRSFRDSVLLIVSVPATASVLLVGAMYLLDVPWNPGTVSMASIALGIGIDYALHVHERYEELRETTDMDAPAAMETALRKLSRPVFGSAFTTLAGFGVVVLSRFPVVSNFGTSLVLVMTLSLLATFVVLPAALLVDRPRVVRRDSDRPVVRAGADPNEAAGLLVSEVSDGGTGEFLWGARLRDFLDADEAVLAVVASATSDIRYDTGEDSGVVSPGDDCRTLLVVTDERLRLIVGGAEDDTHWDRAIGHSSVRSFETRKGLRRSRLAVVTRDDRTYHVRLPGRPDLDSVAAVAGRTVDRWTGSAPRIEDVTAEGQP